MILIKIQKKKNLINKISKFQFKSIYFKILRLFLRKLSNLISNYKMKFLINCLKYTIKDSIN